MTSLPLLREQLRAIIDAGLYAVNAERLTARAVPAAPWLPEFLERPSPEGRLVLIAAGKPAGAMVRGFVRGVTTVLGRARSGMEIPAGPFHSPVCESAAAPHPFGVTRGMIATAHLGLDLPASLRLFVGGHPVPTRESLAAGRHALALADAAAPADRLVVLLSGGASALLAAPAEGLSLEDKMQATRVLLAGGAAIHELNAVRKHLSAIKGGRLAVASRCPVHTLALSDVIAPVDDDPAVIGSGPTVGDATTFADALAAIDRLGVRRAIPAAVIDLLEAGAAGRWRESAKPGDASLARGTYTLVGSRRDAMAAARTEAERLGFATITIDEAIFGEAREAAPRLLARARALAAQLGGSGADRRGTPDARGRPCCVIASGETTVRVTGTGKGGRNQEFALALADLLAEPNARPSMDSAARRDEARLTMTPIAAACVGTDGIDGPTDAAGAIVDATTSRRARALGLGAPRTFLANNDAYRCLDAVGDLLRTGPTDTNVGDLCVILFRGEYA